MEDLKDVTLLFHNYSFFAFSPNKTIQLDFSGKSDIEKIQKIFDSSEEIKKIQEKDRQRAATTMALLSAAATTAQVSANYQQYSSGAITQQQYNTNLMQIQMQANQNAANIASISRIQRDLSERDFQCTACSCFGYRFEYPECTICGDDGCK
jgi:phosphoenolpyruvate carboxylase